MRRGTIDVWVVDLDGPAPLHLLDAAEVDRAARIIRPDAARRWATSRGVLAALRAEYAGANVSVSHSGGIGLIAFATEPIGVDVEHARRIGRKLGTARRAFGDELTEKLGRLAPPQREREFLSQWTLREARIKLGGDDENVWSENIALPDGAIGAVAAQARRTVETRCWS